MFPLLLRTKLQAPLLYANHHIDRPLQQYYQYLYFIISDDADDDNNNDDYSDDE